MKTFVLIIFFIYFDTVKAEILKPNPSLEPDEVISIQLLALKNNNDPYKNAGIEQTWEFAHPTNRIFTGPLSHFINMMYSDGYSIMLEHRQHEIVLVKIDTNISYFFVELMDKSNDMYGFQWIVEKVLIEGDFKDCWMTKGVSLPILLNKSA